MEKIIRLEAVIERTGLSRSTIYDMCSKNLFPQSIKITDRTVGWLESEIESWINERVSLRTIN